MLRKLVLLLLLANAGYLAWTQGWLAPLGLAPASQTEPFRLAQQLRPEALRLLPPEARDTPAAPSPAASAATPELPAPGGPAAPGSPAAAGPPPPTECLQAGLFTAPQASALRAQLLLSLPEGSWALDPAVEPARWIIYMGRYANETLVAKKRAELSARGVRFEPVDNPALRPGLSLGRFDSKASADLELARDAERGVRTARVIQERAEVRGQMLKVPVVTADIRSRLAAVQPQLAGKPLVACR